jgi:hypothetical protein
MKGCKINKMRLVKHVGLALAVVLVAWGCNENSTKPQPKQSIQEERGQSPQDGQVQTPGQQEAPASGEPDAYGRMPGDAHYGHDHPLLEEELQNRAQQGNPVEQGSPAQQGTQIQQGSPVQTQQQAPADGEPDKYGRMPGDAHYGHDHPLLEEELNNQ